MDPQGTIKEVIGFGNDVTDLNIARNELKEYARTLENLVKERTKELEESNKKLLEGNSRLGIKKNELEKQVNLMLKKI